MLLLLLPGAAHVSDGFQNTATALDGNALFVNDYYVLGMDKVLRGMSFMHTD